MASPIPQDPLETLQLMVTDVLVQTGKALRASRKDGHGSTSQAHGSLQSKLPETIRTFHSALDGLENDIIRAKSVLLRDISELQAQKNPPIPAPQPVEAQSKSPMVIDIESSSPVDTGNRSLLQGEEVKQMAPFPDMGLDITETAPVTAAVKEEGAPSELSLFDAEDSPDVKIESNAAPPAAMAPIPMMDEPSMEAPSDAPLPDISSEQQDSKPNFTDMAFTLATNNDAQESQPTKDEEPNFDLTTFAPTESNDDISLDTLIPPKPTTGDNIPSTNVQDNSFSNPELDMKKETGGDGLDVVYDFGPDADGTDFDFNIDGGLGEETFDSLMDSRDQNFDLMEHGEFDAEFFGLGKEDT
ncbi:hypothetical protein HJFPF1_03479 [Paramyrothecium foliicola]|nr:hypothetical protein HJFPF1_03479 [Paramyrothecium foliicola]